MPLVCDDFASERRDAGRFCFLASQGVVFGDFDKTILRALNQGSAEEGGGGAPRPGARAEVRSARRGASWDEVCTRPVSLRLPVAGRGWVRMQHLCKSYIKEVIFSYTSLEKHPWLFCVAVASAP